MSTDAWTNVFLQRSQPACPVCRRPVGDLSSGKCPRCKSRLAVGLGAVQPFLLPWGVMLAGLAAAAGLGLILDLAVLPRERFSNVVSLRDLYLWTDLLAGPVGLGMVALALWKRRRFCALPRPVQWTLAILAAITPIVLAFFFIHAKP